MLAKMQKTRRWQYEYTMAYILFCTVDFPYNVYSLPTADTCAIKKKLRIAYSITHYTYVCAFDIVYSIIYLIDSSKSGRTDASKFLTNRFLQRIHLQNEKKQEKIK